MDATLKNLPNKEEIILNPVKRMRTLFDSSAISIDSVSEIPIERFLTEMSKMYDMGLMYMNEGQIEKAAVLFLRHVAVDMDVLPNHSVYPYMNFEAKNAINKRSHDGIEHTTRIRQILGRLYEEEAMRLFNAIVDSSKFGKIVLEKYSDGRTGFGEIVKEIRNMEKDELDVNGPKLKMMPQVNKPEMILTMPSDIIEKYRDAVKEDDVVGVLLGTKIDDVNYLVSNVLLPGKQHTGWNAEKFVTKIVVAAAALGMIPLGLIHSCNEYFICDRHKCRIIPPIPNIPNAVYPPPPNDHHIKYSACPHLYAQLHYQTISPIAVSIIAKSEAENQCVSISSAGKMLAARRALYNGELTTKANHVIMSDIIHTAIIDLRETNLEIEMEIAMMDAIETPDDLITNNEIENNEFNLN